ncbi:MAG: DUF3109 family protein [Bacteroidetes bacterium]|nr:DUF3109 family protein [Bacteroidota bacterium]
MSEETIEVGGTKFELKIFTEGFEHRNGPNACTSHCCRHGVYLDPVERDRIMNHADIIQKYLDETQTRDSSKWFNNTLDEDKDFPSGVCVSTEVYNDKCVFLREDGRCTLQVTEKEEGMKRFSLKPFYCVLFPIVKVDGVIEYDDFCSGDSPCCTALPDGAPKMVESCRIELEHVLGAEKYKQVLDYYHKNFSAEEKKVSVK